MVWFGEGIDPEVIELSAKATRCGVFITAGTSSVVNIAAGFHYSAKGNGAFTVEIDSDETPASADVDLSIRAAGIALPDVERDIGVAILEASPTRRCLQLGRGKRDDAPSVDYEGS